MHWTFTFLDLRIFGWQLFLPHSPNTNVYSMPRQRRRGRKEKKDDKKVDAPIDSIDDLDQQHQPDLPQSMNQDHLDQERKFRFTSYGRVEEEIMGYFKHVEETLDDPPFETAEGIVLHLSKHVYILISNPI